MTNRFNLMNWFKIFSGSGKKDIKTQKVDIATITTKLNSVLDIGKENKSIATIEKHYSYLNNEIGICSFNKILRDDAKSNTLENVLKMFQLYIDQNKALFTYDDAFQLTNCIFTILKNFKIGTEEIDNFFKDHLSRFEELNSHENIAQIFNLYLNVHKTFSLNFYNNIKYRPIDDVINYRDHINNVYSESEYLFKIKRYDDAFRNLCQANQYIYFLDIKDRVWWMSKNSNLMAIICKNEKTQMSQKSYLIYITATYLFKNLSEYLNFPPYTILSKVPSSTLRYWWKFNFKDLSQTFEYFQINTIQNFLSEIDKYVTYYLPQLYGIPFEYLNAVYENLRSDAEVEIINELGLDINNIQAHELPEFFYSESIKRYREKRKLNQVLCQNNLIHARKMIKLRKELLESFDDNIFEEILNYSSFLVSKYVNYN